MTAFDWIVLAICGACLAGGIIASKVNDYLDRETD